MPKPKKKTSAAGTLTRIDLRDEGIESRIFLIRGQKVLLDRHLAALYQVKAIALRQQVRRNPKRFPADFVFELNELEIESLVSQNVIPSRKYLGGSTPLAFTEQGIAMLSSVLTSDRAIEVNLAIMRTFVKMRHLLAGHQELSRRLEEVEWTQAAHSNHLEGIFETLRQLVDPPALEGPRRQMGFPAGA